MPLSPPRAHRHNTTRDNNLKRCLHCRRGSARLGGDPYRAGMLCHLANRCEDRPVLGGAGGELCPFAEERSGRIDRTDGAVLAWTGCGLPFLDGVSLLDVPVLAGCGAVRYPVGSLAGNESAAAAFDVRESCSIRLAQGFPGTQPPTPDPVCGLW